MAGGALNLAEIEEKWISTWKERSLYHSEPDDRESYTIVIPPPNVTGVLHMGHALNNTIQDVLARRKRTEGYNVCWVPGTDHASIATEAKVVAALKVDGLSKEDVGRAEFLRRAFEWKDKYGGIILKQLERLGASCDWQRTTFTMDEHYYQSVVKVFVDLYKEGLIYKGSRIINWDPIAKTALSDEEVVYRPTHSELVYIYYPGAEDEREGITIATTRPETILADTAIAVHPDDERYKRLVGKKVKIPLLGREIPVIADDYVDPEFGAGALKVTPAHSKEDFEIGQRHNLPLIDILDDSGYLNEEAKLYVGLDRFQVRKLIVADLDKADFLKKTEYIQNNLGRSERTSAVVEPKLSSQWFCNVDVMAAKALKAVEDEQVKLYPPHLVNTYRHWLENIKQWCISRQLWWGQRIPAWYAPTGEVLVGENVEEALQQLPKDTKFTASDLKQDEDVLDTWFSSWLWPLAVFNGLLEPDNEDFKYYYPTSTIVTGPDIIFFWIARMIMLGYKYEDARPFNQVVFTGLVRDKKGQKMSKSLGNSPDLLELIHKFGADGVRFGVLISSPAGNDLLFDESLCEQGRNFANKLYNACKLLELWQERAQEDGPTHEHIHSWYSEKASLL